VGGGGGGGGGGGRGCSAIIYPKKSRLEDNIHIRGLQQHSRLYAKNLRGDIRKPGITALSQGGGVNKVPMRSPESSR